MLYYSILLIHKAQSIRYEGNKKAYRIFSRSFFSRRFMF